MNISHKLALGNAISHLLFCSVAFSLAELTCTQHTALTAASAGAGNGNGTLQDLANAIGVLECKSDTVQIPGPLGRATISYGRPAAKDCCGQDMRVTAQLAIEDLIRSAEDCLSFVDKLEAQNTKRA